MFLSLCFYLVLSFIEFLPQILKLSLPGLEASDHTKTMMSLQLFSIIFHWIPVMNEYTNVGIVQPHQSDYLLIIDNYVKSG